MVSAKRLAVLLLFSLVFCVGCKDKLERSVDDYLKADRELCDLLGKIHDKQTLGKYSSQVLDKCREVHQCDKKMRSIKGPQFEVDDLEEKIKKQDRKLDAAYEASFRRIAGIEGGPEFIDSMLNILMPGGVSSDKRFELHLPRMEPINYHPPKIERPKIPDIHVPRPSRTEYASPRVEHPFEQEKKEPVVDLPEESLVDLSGKKPEELAGFFNHSEGSIATEAIRCANRVDPDSVTNDVRKIVAVGLKEVAEDSQRRSIDRCEALKGVVIWGGEHSKPILLKVLQETVQLPSMDQAITMQKIILDALNRFEDRSYPDTVSQVLALGNGNMYEASKYLARVGPGAESAVIQNFSTVSPDLTKEMIELLGQIGDQASLSLFRKLQSEMTRSAYAQIKDDVNAARRKIMVRRKGS